MKLRTSEGMDTPLVKWSFGIFIGYLSVFGLIFLLMGILREEPRGEIIKSLFIDKTTEVRVGRLVGLSLFGLLFSETWPLVLMSICAFCFCTYVLVKYAKSTELKG